MIIKLKCSKRTVSSLIQARVIGNFYSRCPKLSPKRLIDINRAMGVFSSDGRSSMCNGLEAQMGMAHLRNIRKLG